MKLRQLTCSVLLVGLFLQSCGTIAGNPNDKKPKGDSGKQHELPQVYLIQISNLGHTSADTNCDRKQNVLDYIFNSLCRAREIVAEKLLTVGEPAAACSALPVDKNSWTLWQRALCDNALQRTDKVKSVVNDLLRASFTDFGSDDPRGIGYWRLEGGDEQRYPSRMRLWKPNASTVVQGITAWVLQSATEGKVSFDLSAWEKSHAGFFTFKVPGDANLCRSAPSQEHCYTQRLYYGRHAENDTIFNPTGVDGWVMADRIVNPQFLILEGKATYSAADMTRVLGDVPTLPTDLSNLRELYFRVVQTEQEIFFSLHHKDADGNTLIITMDTPFGRMDAGKLLRDGLSGQPYGGLCQDLTVGTWKACTTIVPADFNALWLGESAFNAPTTHVDLGISFDAPPQTTEIISP